MPNPSPIKHYTAAVEAYHSGRKDDACKLLASALGAEQPSPALVHSIDKFLKPGTLANEYILQIVATEVAKGGGKWSKED